jgi:hypothetical protein
MQRRQPIISRFRRLTACWSSTNAPSAVAYSACMRSHGMPNFPDPDSKGMPGQADPEHLGVSSSRYQAAEQACQHLLPTGGPLQYQTQQCLLFGDCPQTLLQQLLTVERMYAQCTRTHGCPTGPTPRSAPRAALSSTSVVPASTRSPRIRRRSRPRKPNAGA